MSDTINELPPKNRLPVSVGAESEKGLRLENQDHMTGFASAFGAIYLVADGMGGHQGGATASRVVTERFRAHLLEIDPNLPCAEALALATRLTNRELLSKSRSGDPNLTGMGSTMALALIRESARESASGFELVTAHVGDSRVYLQRDGHLTLLTKDHTYVQRLLDSNAIDEETARTHPDASVLTRAMGHSEEVDPDVSEPIGLGDGDGILLCSDGLSGFVRHEEIEEAVRQNPGPTECAKALVQLALNSGSDDNVTVQFVRLGSNPAPVARPGTKRKTQPEAEVLPDIKGRGGPPASRREPGTSQGRRWLLPAVLIAALAVAGVLLGLKFFGGGPPPETVVRMEGSTTIGLKLAPALVKAYLSQMGATDIQTAVVKGNGEETTFQITGKMPGKARRQQFVIVADGTGKGFAALKGGTADIGMASTKISDDQARDLSASEKVVALDGIAVIVSQANPVQALPLSQIGSIFSGAISDWAKLGAASGPIRQSQPIHLYIRSKGSGTRDEFGSMVFRNNQDFSPLAHEKADGQDIANAVAADPNGIGFVPLPEIGNARALAISDGSAGSEFIPTQRTVEEETYKLSRRLYLYVSPKISALAMDFVKFATDDRGRAVTESIGYASLKPPHVQPPEPVHSKTSASTRRRT